MNFYISNMEIPLESLACADWKRGIGRPYQYFKCKMVFDINVIFSNKIFEEMDKWIEMEMLDYLKDPTDVMDGVGLENTGFVCTKDLIKFHPNTFENFVLYLTNGGAFFSWIKVNWSKDFEFIQCYTTDVTLIGSDLTIDGWARKRDPVLLDSPLFTE